MNSKVPGPSIDKATGTRPDEARAGYTTEAIQAGADGVTFLSDPVNDQLVRVVMELGAALWVERRRTRTLERVLQNAGALAPDAMEQWIDEPADAEADRKELEQWMKRIYGPLTHIASAGQSTGEDR